MPLPPFGSFFTGSLTRGFYFQCPTSCVITGLSVPDITDPFQVIEVIDLGTTAPPAFPATVLGTQLFYDNSTAGQSLISTNITLVAGNWYGVLGAGTATIGGSVSQNPYSTASAPFTSDILGIPTDIHRFLTQSGIGANGGGQPVSSAPGTISRVEVHVSAACAATGPSNANIGASASPQSLTTLPNFAGGNGGSTGGAVYFTLEVASLMNLTGIDVNTSATVGNAIGADLYVNTVETDVTLLTGTSPALAAANWDLVGCLSGTSAGFGSPSAASFQANHNPTLMPGQYLMAIVGDFAHRYTNGTPTNSSVSGAALTCTGGAASNIPFANSGFFTPRILNATFHYEYNACGTRQVTTPPNFAGGNGGNSGGAVYFQLDVTGGFGRTLCGIDVHTSATAGTPLTTDLYVNNVETDISLLTSGSPSLAAGNWCRVGTMTGTSNGFGLPSPMAFSTPVDLPLGSYVMAMIGNYAHRYTNGTATNAVIDDPLACIRVTGGSASNTPFSSSLFTPRILNATFHVDVPTSPITNFPLEALATPVGAGCGGEPAQIYEVFGAGTFDLVAAGGQDLLFNLAGGTLSTSTAPRTAIIPPVAADLGLGSDQNSALIPLGFTVEGICASTMSVASNGYIWLGDLGRIDFTETESEFIGEGARLAVYWTDLGVSFGGSIHVDLSPNLAIVTYDHVFPFGGTASEVTAQVEIRPDSILVRYDPAGGAFTDPVIVGLTNGDPPVVAPGSVDLSGGAIPPTPLTSSLRLTTPAPPLLGSTASFHATGFPVGSLGATVMSIGPALPGISLFPLTPPGCEQYVGFAFDPLALFFSTCEGTASLPIPPNNILMGLPFTVQSASLGAQVLTSNGLDCRVGCF